jgi:glutamate-1-semialdehyde aminotransferase
MIAAKTCLNYLLENESDIYPKMARIAKHTRDTLTRVFAEKGIHIRFAGDRIDALPGHSLHLLLFPYEKERALDVPEEVRNPAVCDLTLGENVLQLALLLENIYTVHGLGCTTAAHTETDIEYLADGCRRAIERIEPYL